MRKLFLALFVSTLVLTACNKDDDTEPLTNLEILQLHKWKYSAMHQYDGTTTEDIFTEDNCETDDVFEFKSNMEVDFYTGTKKCYLDQPDLATETYWLSENMDTLHFPGEDVPTLLKSVTEDKMVWEAQVTKEGKLVTVTQELVEDK